MRELNENQVVEVNGAFGPALVLGGAITFLTYVNATGTAQSFGRGLGMGFYDAIHKSN
ncbi:hypothetical protein [Aliiglaciecola litoralis]|uniref:Class IIb bacteriocin, lactobin A/cerein 7B family n=1 Tax=Aliiglaciecola litoralis TaxID=582857 RepID=A0ABN1LDQ1_9ALTE